MTDYTVGQQLWQMAQMAVVGWVMLLTAHEKQSLALCGRWRYGKKTVIDFLFCLLWGVLLWLVLLRVSGGLLRNYIVFGLLSGAIVYHLACRRWLNRPCLFLARGNSVCMALVLPVCDAALAFAESVVLAAMQKDDTEFFRGKAGNRCGRGKYYRKK